MADGGVFVHRAASDAHAQITRLFDFISPTIAAMWNLRWQVQGFVNAVPAATQQDIVKRFALGSGVRGNEIRRACIDVSWDEQRDRFSAIILTNSIAIFEDFTEQIAALSLSGRPRDEAARNLQFPTTNGLDGYKKAYAVLNKPVIELKGVFSPAAKTGRWYSGSHLQNLLICYRFFKESRNAYIHGGGRASPRLINAYAAFAPVATEAALGLERVPPHEIPSLGDPVRLDPLGVNWFCNVILRLVATYDADLSESKGALSDVQTYLPSVLKSRRSHLSDPRKVDNRIAKLAMAGRFPPPILTPQYREFLKNTDRIPSYW